MPIILSRPCKLLLEQHLLNFILYIKHNNVRMYNAFMWNWSKNNLCDDVVFIKSCINDALG